MPTAYAPLLATLAAQESNVLDPRALLSQQPFQSFSPRGRQDLDVLRQLLANQIAREATQTARETPNIFRPGEIGRLGYETYLGGLEREIAEAREGRLQAARAADVRPIRDVERDPSMVRGVKLVGQRVEPGPEPRAFRTGGITSLREMGEVATDPNFPAAMRAQRGQLLSSGAPGVQRALIEQETALTRTDAAQQLQKAKDAAAMARALVVTSPQQAAVAARMAIAEAQGLIGLVRERTQAERYGAGEPGLFGIGGDPENVRLMQEAEQVIRGLGNLTGTGAGAGAAAPASADAVREALRREGYRFTEQDVQDILNSPDDLRALGLTR